MTNHTGIDPNRIGPSQRTGSGTERREVTEDANAGSLRTTVRQQTLAGIITPTKPDLSNVGAGLRALSELAKFGSAIALEEFEDQAEADFLEGQSLIQAGQTIEEIKASGASTFTLRGANTLQSANALRILEAGATANIDQTADQNPTQFAKTVSGQFKNFIDNLPDVGREQRTFLLGEAGKAISRITAEQTTANQQFIKQENLNAFTNALRTSARLNDSSELASLLSVVADGGMPLGLSNAEASNAIITTMETDLLAGVDTSFKVAAGLANVVDQSLAQLLNLDNKQLTRVLIAKRTFDDRQRSKFNLVALDGIEEINTMLNSTTQVVPARDVFALYNDLSKRTNITVENLITPASLLTSVEQSNKRVLAANAELTPAESDRIGAMQNIFNSLAQEGKTVTQAQVRAAYEKAIGRDGEKTTIAQDKAINALQVSLNNTARSVLRQQAKDLLDAPIPGLQGRLLAVEEEFRNKLFDARDNPDLFKDPAFVESYLDAIENVIAVEFGRPDLYNQAAQAARASQLYGDFQNVRAKVETQEAAQLKKITSLKASAASISRGQTSTDGLSPKEISEGFSYLVTTQLPAEARDQGITDPTAIGEFVDTKLIAIWKRGGVNTKFMEQRVTRELQAPRMFNSTDGSPTAEGVAIANLMNEMFQANGPLADQLIKSPQARDAYFVLKANGFDPNLTATDLQRQSVSRITDQEVQQIIGTEEFAEQVTGSLEDIDVDIGVIDSVLLGNTLGEFTSISAGVERGSEIHFANGGVGHSAVVTEIKRLVVSGRRSLAANPDALIEQAKSNVLGRTSFLGTRPITHARGTVRTIDRLGIEGVDRKGAPQIAFTEYLASRPVLERIRSSLPGFIADVVTSPLPFVGLDAQVDQTLVQLLDGVADFEVFDLGDGNLHVRIQSAEKTGAPIEFTMEAADVGKFQRNQAIEKQAEIDKREAIAAGTAEQDEDFTLLGSGTRTRLFAPAAQ